MPGVQTCALRSEEHTSELQSHDNLVCRLLLEKKTDNENPAVWRRSAFPSSPLTCSWLTTPRYAVGSLVLCRPGDGSLSFRCLFFFFNDTATTEIYTLSLHDALPILLEQRGARIRGHRLEEGIVLPAGEHRSEEHTSELQSHDNLVCRLLLEKKKTIICTSSYCYVPHTR